MWARQLYSLREAAQDTLFLAANGHDGIAKRRLDKFKALNRVGAEPRDVGVVRSNEPKPVDLAATIAFVCEALEIVRDATQARRAAAVI